MLGGNVALAARYAAGLEMLHCYSLIHDDLPCMDNDDMRRGRPSCHKAYGEATALLAGDALLTAAFETLACAGQGTPAQNAQAVAVLSAAAGARGMVRGQELDLAYEAVPASEAQLCEVHRNKTGMLIAAAAQLGAVASGASQAQQDALRQFAFSVGLVFQMVDDAGCRIHHAGTGQAGGQRRTKWKNNVCHTAWCGGYARPGGAHNGRGMPHVGIHFW